MVLHASLNITCDPLDHKLKTFSSIDSIVGVLTSDPVGQKLTGGVLFNFWLKVKTLRSIDSIVGVLTSDPVGQKLHVYTGFLFAECKAV